MSPQNIATNDKETGQKRYKTEILVNELVLLSGREDGARMIPRMMAAIPVLWPRLSLSGRLQAAAPLLRPRAPIRPADARKNEKIRG